MHLAGPLGRLVSGVSDMIDALDNSLSSDAATLPLPGITSPSPAMALRTVGLAGGGAGGGRADVIPAVAVAALKLAHVSELAAAEAARAKEQARRLHGSAGSAEQEPAGGQKAQHSGGGLPATDHARGGSKVAPQPQPQPSSGDGGSAVRPFTPQPPQDQEGESSEPLGGKKPPLPARAGEEEQPVEYVLRERLATELPLAGSLTHAEAREAAEDEVARLAALLEKPG